MKPCSTSAAARGAEKNRRAVVVSVLALTIGMFMLSYAAVPLYRLFCQVTGYGGATRQAETGQPAPLVIAREMNLFFNADSAGGLPLSFRPLQKDVTFAVGAPQTVYYEARNTGDAPLELMATFNVTPEKAGKYFVKVACFCFEPQHFAPGEKRKLPVTFYIDPAIDKDEAMRGVTHMTLSYTFFKNAAS